MAIMKGNITIVVIGHVDSGKSTTTGHLMYKLGGVDDATMKECEKEAAARGKPFLKYAFVFDKLKAERDRGATIDISLRSFTTMKNRYTVIDAPGHLDRIQNMITGTSQADCAILMIDSTAGAFKAGSSSYEQTREHANLAFTLGVKHMICCINKMDATIPPYSEDIYKEIVFAVSNCIHGIAPEGINVIPYIPISGYEGINLIVKSQKPGWYKGQTLLHAIDHIVEPKRLVDRPLRLPLQDVYKIWDLTVPVGKIATGIIESGMEVIIGPSDFKVKVESRKLRGFIEGVAYAGETVGFCVKDNPLKDIKIGYVVSDSKNDPCKGAVSFISEISIMNHPGRISNGYTPILSCHTSHIAVKFGEILSKIDEKTGEEIEKEPKFLMKGDRGLVKMLPTKPMVVETLEEYPPLGRFIIRDMNQIVGMGVIKSVDKKNYHTTI